MAKLTDGQRETLRLVNRSPGLEGGWRSCSPVVFEQLIAPMPDELVEKDATQRRVRLTDKGITLIEWL